MIGGGTRVRIGAVLGRLVVGILAAVLVAALAAGLAPWTNAGASGPRLPTADPFYEWHGSLIHDESGTILRTRTTTVAYEGGPTTTQKDTQLLYVTTNELGHRTVSVATVLQPLGEAAPAPTRLVSYQPAYDALGAECDPSYTLQLGTEGESPLAERYVATGDTVVIADYEGEDLAYGAGQQSGYETLDAIRATEKWLGVPEASTPVGMVGYSGGSIATEFALRAGARLCAGPRHRRRSRGRCPGRPVPQPRLHRPSGIGLDLGQIPALLDGLVRAFAIPDFDTLPHGAGHRSRRRRPDPLCQ